ncbi:hypothetical protein G9A89_010664 [Geosiphon pyriformis]|nr:hypothetical protein G9A89_010664 [Geosiphon pyriformis]
MSDELGQEDVDDLEINNLRAAENLGYDNVKYRDRPTTNTGNGATIEGEGGAIFDIGEEPDDEFAKWTDDESHNGEGGNLPGDSQSHHVAQPDSQRISEDDESSRIRQEISKLN